MSAIFRFYLTLYNLYGGDVFMSDSIYPSTDGVPTFSAKELQNLTYTDSSGGVHLYPFPGAGAGVVQDFDGTVVDQLAYEKDQDVGFTHPNLHRRIVRQDPPETENPLNKELAPREYTLQIHGVDSYRTTEIFVHDEESITTEIP